LGNDNRTKKTNAGAEGLGTGVSGFEGIDAGEIGFSGLEADGAGALGLAGPETDAGAAALGEKEQAAK
jgi:hypothetical protein